MGGAWAGGRLIRERLASVQTRVWKQTEAVSTETTDERRPSLRLTFHLSQGRRARGVSWGLDATDASWRVGLGPVTHTDHVTQSIS